MNDRELITETLHSVRRRWRARLALEAGVRFALLAIFVVGAWTLALSVIGGTGLLLTAVRVGGWAAIGLGLGLEAFRVFRRRPGAGELALYLEEHAPALRQSVVSAVALMEAPPPPVPLVDRVLAGAREGLASVRFGRDVESTRIYRAGGWLGALTLGSAALLWLGPQFLRDSTSSLVNPWRKPPAAAPFTVAVEPGDAEVPKGGAQRVSAALGGFTSEVVELVYRSDSTGDWDRVPMERDSLAGRFLARLLEVTRPTEYFVEASGIRSPVYHLKVVDLPAVNGLAATISPPAYTNQPPETIDPAADLTVLNGSMITLRAKTTRPAKAARLLVQGRAPIELRASPSGGWVGSFKVAGDGFYRIDLEAPDGRVIKGLEYAIDALADAPPTVRITAPGRDTKVTSVEEVTTELSAADDFGVRRLELHYSVNGGAEQTVTLADSAVANRKELSAAHTLYLEEWHLKPGDVVSYFGRAVDGAGHVGSSDMYFLEVRPFDKTYRQAEQSGGGGGGGGESAEGLSEHQRQIVVGTFNVLRDSAAQAERAWQQNVTTLAIAQGRLVGEVTSLLTKLKARALGQDTLFQVIATQLDSAVGRMHASEELLAKRNARAALPEEQRALVHLERAEAAYREVQIAMGNQSGGGGGSSKQATAEELADLFELETDKLRNQYESVQREAGEQAERKLDETLERLRRLASRQEQENERMQRAAGALRNRSAQSGGGGSGGSQRQLADETEQAARQLERLAREKNSPAMAEQARRLQEAAEAMRRAASSGGDQGSAQGNTALDRLKSTTRELERSRSAGREEAIRRLANRAEELRAKAKEASDQAQGLPKDEKERSERLDNLSERKEGMARDVDRLADDAERLGRESARDQPNSARKLGQAAEGLKNGRVGDKLRFSRDLAKRGSPEAVRSLDQQIQEDLAEAARQLKDAAGSIGESPADRQARALDRARDLVRGLSSLEDRARARNQSRGQGKPGEPGKEGQPNGQENGQPSGQPSGQSGKASGQPGAENRQPGESPSGRSEGENSGQPATGAPRGQPNGSAVPNGDPTGRADPGGDVRQLVRELRTRRQAAESLRADLRAMGQDVTDLDRMIKDLARFENGETFGSIRGVDRLHDEVIEGLKSFEFALWRKFGDSGEQRPALGASAQVPPQYRELVEEYYRSLARGKPKGSR